MQDASAVQHNYVLSGLIHGYLCVSLRCFAFAELPWYQRKVAALIFSSPPTSTYEEVRTPQPVPLFFCLTVEAASG